MIFYEIEDQGKPCREHPEKEEELQILESRLRSDILRSDIWMVI